MSDREVEDAAALTEQPIPEDSVDAVRGIVEMLYCMRDAFWSNGVRGDNMPAGRGADFLVRELSRHIDVIEDALFPGRRQL
jgi:hypothetical protein